jgi:hypothetical protein
VTTKEHQEYYAFVKSCHLPQPSLGRPRTFVRLVDERHIAIFFFFLWATDDNGVTRRYVPCFGIKGLYQRHHDVIFQTNGCSRLCRLVVRETNRGRDDLELFVVVPRKHGRLLSTRPTNNRITLLSIDPIIVDRRPPLGVSYRRSFLPCVVAKWWVGLLFGPLGPS